MKNLAALAMACCAAHAGAASIYLTPSALVLPPDGILVVPPDTNVAFDLMMNFAANEPTVGGGIDLDATGVASLVSFVPSSYFLNTADPAFSGFGTLRADRDLEIHFGSFNGLSGQNKLGTLTVQASGIGTGTVDIAINSFFGGFFSATTSAPMNVALTGAMLATPEPQSVAMLLAGLGVIAGAAALRRRAG